MEADRDPGRGKRFAHVFPHGIDVSALRDHGHELRVLVVIRDNNNNSRGSKGLRAEGSVQAVLNLEELHALTHDLDLLVPPARVADPAAIPPPVAVVAGAEGAPPVRQQHETLLLLLGPIHVSSGEAPSQDEKLANVPVSDRQQCVWIQQAHLRAVDRRADRHQRILWEACLGPKRCAGHVSGNLGAAVNIQECQIPWRV
mmetsp:Transcript_25442/g.70919  ORF Transcript_25442/g.70919 Transcript_25442/m.70919 type:complete len:200 (-) Transcript_25442:1487-2086(-)